MPNFLKGGKYSYKPTGGYRSGLEVDIAKQIENAKQIKRYEDFHISYIKPQTHHKYTPDFVLDNGIIIECKGLFETVDRQKHLYIKRQYPNLDVRFVFTNPANKIYKGSKTTYGKWCEKYGFKYSKKVIPIDWFKEQNKNVDGLIKKEG